MMFLFSSSPSGRRKAEMDAPVEGPWQALLDKVRAGLMVRTDSRLVNPGEVFVAMPAAGDKRAQFIRDAVARGAETVVSAEPVEPELLGGAALLPRPDAAEALGELARAYFKTGQAVMKTIGVTGTNGKTTTSYLIEHILAAAGLKVGVLGTVTYRWPGFSLDASLTTPGCWQLHDLFANMAKSDVDVVVMEVSSHALDQKRVAGLSFDVAVLTNVTQDHLDYHGTMESYFQAKSRLFRDCPAGDKRCVLNWDDPYGRRLLAEVHPSLGYGLTDEPLGDASLAGTILSCTGAGLHLRMTYKGKSWELTSPLVGAHNAQNLLAAQAACLSLGLSCKEARRLAEFQGVPGRLERVPNEHGLAVFVDYAHTPDALVNVQKTLRSLDFRRLVTVFGCGGNRDRGKRPLMARAVADYADVAVLTSDNPRFEDPLEIMADARPGLFSGPRKPEIVEEPDRYQALCKAVGLMAEGDVLLVAGKGHESYQQVGDRKLPFSDVEAVQRAIREVLG